MDVEKYMLKPANHKTIESEDEKGDVMFKKMVFLFVLLAALMVAVGPARALQYAATLYVDTAYVGTENGTQQNPYNDLNEAKAIGQTLPYGADIYQKQPDGSWKKVATVNPVYPGQTGTPLAGPILFGILVVFSLVLVVAGLLLKRRSRALAH